MGQMYESQSPVFCRWVTLANFTSNAKSILFQKFPEKEEFLVLVHSLSGSSLSPMNSYLKFRCLYFQNI